MITDIVKAITGNPWFLVAALGLGLASGASGAWYVQGLRLDAVKAEYEGFVTTTKAAGVAATKVAKEAVESDNLKKQKADNDYEDKIATLSADNERLRKSRTSRGYVPPSPVGSGRSDFACFDRGSLEQALRQFDEETAGLIAEGDQKAVSLDVARVWAAGIRKQ